jgi:peptidoglycan/LPS O-acetylase OafA/YrhL
LTILVVLAMVSYGVLYNSTFAFQNGVIDPVLAQGSPVVYVWLYAIMQPLFSLMLILFFLKICILWREPRSVATRSMERIGEDSFGIYLTQSFYVGVFGSVLIRLGLGVANLLFYLIVVVSVLVASYVTVHLIYRLPLSEIIVGRPRKSTAM